MAKGNRGPIDYIMKPDGTKNLAFRYQFPAGMGWPQYKKTLGTPDMKIARERAAPHLMKCVAWVAEYKSRLNASAERKQVATLDYRYPVGQHRLEDGTEVHADAEYVYYVAPNGRRWHEANLVRIPVEGEFWTREEYQNAADDGHLGDGELWEHDSPGWRGEPIELPSHITRPEQCRAPLDGGTIPDQAAPKWKPRPCADDEILEFYLKHRNVTGYYADEARGVWHKFRELTGGKPLKDCDRQDALKLVDYYFAQTRGNKRSTVQKKLMYMCAMANLAVKFNRLKFNPFSGVMPKKKKGESLKREGFTAEDMELVFQSRAVFSAEEWKLWVLLATTGMRLSEAIGIVGEKTEHGIRYIEIRDGKTVQSDRDVPLPDAFLELQPQRIVGRLFPDFRSAPLSKRMNRRINDIGITDPSKVIHSLRHRAKSKLRMEHECKPEFEYALLGHEKITQADRYGKRPPMTVLKPWIEMIGLIECGPLPQ